MADGNPYKPLRISNGVVTKCKMGEEDYMLISPIWQKLRTEAFKRDGFRCQKCNSAFNLELHHDSYPEVWGDEPLYTLHTLCDSCHREVHGR